MTYNTDLLIAAKRHFRAAEELLSMTSAGAQPGCKAVAGYLFGLAGELALKQIMRESGIRPLPERERRDDPFFAHFPDLKERLRDQIQGRRAAQLQKIVGKNSLFQFWNTKMRYAPTQDIQDIWIDKWHCDAKELIAQMETI